MDWLLLRRFNASVASCELTRSDALRSGRGPAGTARADGCCEELGDVLRDDGVAERDEEWPLAAMVAAVFDGVNCKDDAEAEKMA